MNTKEIEKVIGILQNGIEWATESDVDVVMQFCTHAKADIEQGDSAYQHAITMACQSGLCLQDVRQIAPLFTSWDTMMKKLSEQTGDIVTKIVQFLAYWFRACELAAA